MISHTAKKRITTNLKTKDNQNCEKIKPHASPTRKDLKKHSSNLVEEGETGSWGREVAWHGSGLHGQGGGAG